MESKAGFFMFFSWLTCGTCYKTICFQDVLLASWQGNEGDLYSGLLVRSFHFFLIKHAWNLMGSHLFINGWGSIGWFSPNLYIGNGWKSPFPSIHLSHWWALGYQVFTLRISVEIEGSFTRKRGIKTWIQDSGVEKHSGEEVFPICFFSQIGRKTNHFSCQWLLKWFL